MRNENGYTLIITLLMITLIFILGFTLTAGSINSAKQNKLTGSKYLATQIAEMGVVYVEESLNATIDRDEMDVSKVLNQLENIIGDIVSSSKIIDSENSNRFFTIKDDNISNDGNIITLNFISEGTADNRTKALDATLTIIVPLDESGGGGKIDIGTKEEIANGRPINPTELPSGTSTRTIYSGEVNLYPSETKFGGPTQLQANSGLIVDGDVVFDNTITPGNYSIIAVYGNATIDNQLFGAEGFQLLIAGRADADNTITLGKNSILKAAEFETKNSFYLEENAHFLSCRNGNFKYTESKNSSQINICGDGAFNNGGNNFNNNTTTNIKGNAYFNSHSGEKGKGQVTLDTNATLNIGKTLEASNLILKSSSTARIFGDAFLDQMNISGGSNLQIMGDFKVNNRINTLSSDSRIEVFGNTIIGEGIGDTGLLAVYGDLTLSANRSQFSSPKICVKGQINTPTWSSEDRDEVIKQSTAKSCNNVTEAGIYQMPNLEEPSIPDQNNFFQDCTDSCVLNTNSNKVEIDLDEVTY